MALNTSMTKYIFESPDGGETVYRREFGEQHRELVKGDPKAKLQEAQRNYIWSQIVKAGNNDSELKQLLDKAEMYYRLKYDTKI